jgi:hypothetical protein
VGNTEFTDGGLVLRASGVEDVLDNRFLLEAELITGVHLPEEQFKCQDFVFYSET